MEDQDGTASTARKPPKKQRASKVRDVDGATNSGTVEKREITLKKDELRREVNFGIGNDKTIQRVWRRIIMKMQRPILMKEVEVAWHTFDRTLDINNHRTSRAMDAVEKSKLQYERNFRSHAEAIDRFLKIYGTRLRGYENRYRNNLAELVMIYETEHRRIDDLEKEDEVLIRSVMFRTKQQQDETFIDVRSATIAKVDVLREDSANSRRMAATILESELADRWSELRGILDGYESATKQRRQAYEIIRAKDDRERIIIDGQVSNTAVLTESIRKLKNKILHFKVSADERISEIMAEHRFFNEAYREAKKRFFSYRTSDKSRLVFLTKEYRTSMERLNKIVRKAEKILILVRICGKYETEDEKIVYPSFDDSSLITALKNGRTKSQDATDDVNEIHEEELQDLEISFWRRIGNARIITRELELERSRLCCESQFLQESLRGAMSNM